MMSQMWQVFGTIEVFEVCSWQACGKQENRFLICMFLNPDDATSIRSWSLDALACNGWCQSRVLFPRRI